MQEKDHLLPTTVSAARHRSHAFYWRSRIFALAFIVVFWGILQIYSRLHDISVEQEHAIYSNDLLCPQTERLTPIKHAGLYYQLESLAETDSFKQRTVDWLAGAVRIPTESYDRMEPVGQDPRWEIFAVFHAYLLEAYPLIHATLKLTKVNTYGLVYHWQGINPDLKPLLLTAHTDVVPVDPKTVDQWIHPPYSGYFDGTYLWGRGSNDDKNGVIATMASVETLLEKGFNPTRSVVLAYGFDEESSGPQGARKIGDYLLEKYGENSFAMLVDEGTGWEEIYGQIVAVPAVAEKGYMDIHIEVDTPGGHSSLPPPHTSIGMLSSLLVTIESNPPESHLGRLQPSYSTLQCLAAHTPNMPEGFRNDVVDSLSSDEALLRVEDYVFLREPRTKALVSTTQAIDLIDGGVKANALPESAKAVINQRIPTDSDLDAVRMHLTDILTPLASRFNLSFTSFGSEITSDHETYGTLTLSDTWGLALEPAPISPTNTGAFQVLSGSIKASLLDSQLFRNENTSVIVAPGISTGNTDTHYYWKLTRNIFRYSHLGPADSYGGMHTINEAIAIEGVLRQIAFFTTLILNSDESTSL